ncbi:AAA family ATPase [Kribbella koreensis]|uniref:AAA family ATPase n=1 Tax=Kribbella koreensis TaxID=57909 RepID=UPI0031D2BA7E
MHITRLRFDAFKSLHRVECNLDGFTVLTGPNNAGKSNLVDGINFLRETFEYGLEIAVARAGGYDNIVYRNGTQESSVGLGVEVRLTDVEALMYSRRHHRPDSGWDSDGSEYTVELRFTLARAGDEQLPSGFVVLDEHITFRDSEGIVLRMSRDAEGNVAFRRSARMRGRRTPYADLLYPLSDNSFVNFIKSRPTRQTFLSLAELRFGGLISEIFERLASSRVFQLSPHQSRQTGVTTPNAHLDRHGTNLPSAADYMRRNSSKSWRRVQTAMRSVLPELEEIKISYTDDKRLALHFQERGKSKAWNANEVSDGTIQVLALFVALFDERSPFLTVEEPENALHPWVLRQFIDLCREAADKQILLTTHSPVVIDYVPPDALRLVWQRDGKTSVARVTDLNPGLLRLWKDGELRTFDAYDAGLFEEYVPERFLPEAPE